MIDMRSGTPVPRLDGSNISWEFVIGPSDQTLHVVGYECSSCGLEVEVVRGKSQPSCCHQPMRPMVAAPAA